MVTPVVQLSTSPQIVAVRLGLRRDCVIAIYLLTILQGISQSAGTQSNLMWLLSSVLYASAATHWALLDSRLRGRPMLRISQELYFFSWPIAALFYLIATRKWRGLGLWLLTVFSLYATFYLAALATYFTRDMLRG